MVRLPAVLAMSLAALVLTPGPGVAAADQAMCLGYVVTIDLNEPGAPDPFRDDSDVVLGTPGDDHISTGAGYDRVCAGSGEDTILGGDDGDVLDTGEAPEGGREETYGGAGRDSLLGGAGDELLDGGRGANVVTYAGGSADGVTVDLAVSGPQDTGSGGVDELVGIVDLGGTAGDDVLSGDDGANFLGGGSGDDTLVGREGSDEIWAGAGDDSLGGGGGGDRLYGDDDADTVHGGPGGDVIYLRGDAPTDARQEAYGGPGDDYFNSSADDELFVGGGGTDTVSFNYPCRECGMEYPDPWGGVRVDLRLSGPQDTRSRGVDGFSGIEDLKGTGDDDVLLGDGERNRLDGFYGDDTVNGRRGADYLRGGPETDRCIGGPGRDQFDDCERRS